MNSATSCPLSTTVEQMKGIFNSYSRPALLVDTKGKVLARNTRATYKDLPIKIGAYITPFLDSDSKTLLSHMKPGDTVEIKLLLSRETSAAVTRFYSYFFMSINQKSTTMIRNVLNVNSMLSQNTPEILGFCNRLDENNAEDMRGMRKLMGENMLSHMNLNKMLEVIMGTDESATKYFEPGHALRAVCGIAYKPFCNNDLVLSTNIPLADALCHSVEEDYYSALAAMLAIGAKYSSNRVVTVEGAVLDDKYKASVSFKSDMDPDRVKAFQETQRLSVQEQYLNAALLYIRCLAENGAWAFDVSKRQGGKFCISLTVFLKRNVSLTLMRPMSNYVLNNLVMAQLISLDKHD